MMRAKTFRRWLTLFLIASVLAPIVSGVLAGQTALAAPHQLSAGYTIKVVATFTGGVTAPATDSISFDNKTLVGKLVSNRANGSSATYQATDTVTWINDGPPPTLQACSSVLNNKCSAKIVASPGNHTVTITGSTGNPGGGAGDTASQSNSPECEFSNDPMSWILCPIFNGAADFSNWILDSIITPFLITAPVSTAPSDPIYQVWSNFRLYGDIFLVIALLVLVFGEAIGGGLVDAYTVKKALPRVLVAAILVNLSIYIVAFMIDITNIIGKSIGDIIITPFKAAGNWHFSPNGAQGIGVLSIGLIGFFLAKGGILTKLRQIFFDAKAGGITKVAGEGSFLKSALWLALLVAVPMLLALLAVFVTLIVRKGLILFLILGAPVAFALYALPNTEQYFKKWWDLLLEVLMVYPIIIIIFAIADILSITILDANQVNPSSIGTAATSSAASIVAIIVAFILQFLPLFLIPFAFRMAGGTLSKLHEAVAATHGKVAEMGGYKRAREHATQEYADKKTQAAEAMHQSLMNRANAQADTDTGRKRANRYRKMANGGAWGLVGKNIEERVAEMNKREAERRANNTNYGPDDMRRGSTIDKDMLETAKKDGEAGLRREGYVEGKDYRMNNGRLELAELSGEKFFGMGTALAASEAYVGNQGAMQENLAYTMGKASTTEGKARIKSKYGKWARSQGWTRDIANERWIGAAYSDQARDRDYKHHSLGQDYATGGGLHASALGQIKDINNELSSYERSNLRAETYNTLSAQAAVAAEVVRTGTAMGQFADDTFTGPGSMTAAQKAQEFLFESSRLAASLEEGGGVAAGMTGEEGTTPVTVPGATGRGVIGYGSSTETAEAMKAFVASTKVHYGEFQTQAGSIPGGTPILHSPGDTRAAVITGQGRSGGRPANRADRPDNPDDFGLAA
jgi:hypothetical protein